MKRTWTIIGVADVARSFNWYRSLFGQPVSVPAHDYFGQVRVGVENVTDEDPPIFPSYSQSNTDPSQYDVLGRRYYMRLRYSF